MDKKIGVMQPYLFPYLGYFQLISALDVFVTYDDIQFISGGWTNRNRILVNGKPSYITFPLKNSSHTANINERYFVDDIDRYKRKILTGLKLAYSRAPFYKEAFPLIESIINFEESNLALFTGNSIRVLCDHLDIPTKILLSSELPFGKNLAGTERLISVLTGLNADISINPIGGFYMYSCEEFLRHGIELKFIKMENLVYRQFNRKYAPNLSIIDVLMFVSLGEAKKMLKQYSLADNFNTMNHRQERRR